METSKTEKYFLFGLLAVILILAIANMYYMSNERFPLKYIQGCTIKAIYNTRVSRSQTEIRQVNEYGGGRFGFIIDLVKKKRSEHDEIFAFLNKMRGRKETFKLVIPFYSFTKTGYGGSMLVDGANQTGSAVQVDGMTANTKVLKAGDFVKFSNHNKVYIITADLISSAGGAGTLEISPNLFVSPNNDSNVVFNDVEFTVANAKDEITLDLDLSVRAGFNIELEEVFN